MEKINLKQAREILVSQQGDKALVETELQEWWANYLRKHTARYLEMLPYFSRPDKEGEILEFGSMPGHLTVLLKKLGLNITGIDKLPERAKKLWEKYDIKIVKADFETDRLPFDDCSFDKVIFTEILEHIRINPLFTLGEAFRVLKPGGTILLSTPNITPDHKYRFLLGKSWQGDPVSEFKKLEWLGHMGHVRLYNKREVIGLLKATGFSNFSVKYRGGYEGSLFWPAIFFPFKNAFRKYIFIEAEKNGSGSV